MSAVYAISEPLNQGIIMPKDAFYFKHDANASVDLKLKAIRKNFGWVGYGWFWFLIEALRNQEAYKLEYCQLTFDGLAGDMDCSSDKVKDYIDYCINIKLLGKNGSHFYSYRLLRDMEKVDATRELRREAGTRSAQKRLGINICSTSAEQKLNICSTEKRREEKKDKRRVIVPDWINKETWEAFLEMRKTKKAVPTEHGKTLIIKELERLKADGNDPNEVLNQSIMRNYTGVFSVKEKDGTHQRKPSQLPARDKYTRPENV